MSDVATGNRFAISTPHQAATAAGLQAFERGGNAVDAALAAAVVLSVAYPHMCGVGGDLFALVVRPDEEMECINSSGASAAEIDVDGLRTEYGEMPVVGPHPITVPGAVAGWEVLARSGRLGLDGVLEPAVDLSRSGVPVARGLARALASGASSLRTDAGMREVFFGRGRPLRSGEPLVQSALAGTLEQIAEAGAAALYGGRVGAQLIAGLRSLGSPLNEDDLARHEVEVRPALTRSHRDWAIATAPPNSQGFVLLQILAVLDRLGVEPDPLGPDAPIIAEVFERCGRERDRHLCDPRTSATDLGFLTEPDHIERIAVEIGKGAVGERPMATRATGDTIAVAAADSEGWSVSLIQSLFHSFGSQILEPVTGVIGHNRGACFSLSEGSPNVVGAAKRPAHTLMPVIVFKGGRVAAVAGTMGGRAQPQIHAQVLMRLLDGGENAGSAVDAPRWIVGGQDAGSSRSTAFVEGRAGATGRRLAQAGMEVRTLKDLDEETGHYQVVLVQGDGFTGAADPRSDGAAGAV
jgi:oxamate amidohydrolase